MNAGRFTKGAVNVPESVRQRLLNVSTKNNEDFQQILIRYALERLLYRLSVSRHADRFVLKGALLFRIWFDLDQRPTRDADLLGFGAAEPAALKKLFHEVAEMTVEPDDGLMFDSKAVIVEEIRKDVGYPGVRVTLRAELAKALIPVQCDIGFGDVVTPAPVWQSYPTLLDMAAPALRVYPLETVVAEKLEALVKLAAFNTRMKDFFDLWVLMRHEGLDRAVTHQAIRATFGRRGTQFPTSVPVGVTDAFAVDKQTSWKAFLRRSGCRLRRSPRSSRRCASSIGRCCGRRPPWQRKRAESVLPDAVMQLFVSCRSNPRPATEGLVKRAERGKAEALGD